jgi:glycogen phosphorylase
MTTTHKDPVCGMTVPEGNGPSLVYHDGRTFHFCSEFCRNSFQADPGRYAGHEVSREDEPAPAARRIAYFSMEVAFRDDVPTYSGGLGVLAGDTLRSCADLRMPIVAVTLVYRRGYFRQHLDAEGRQHESDA